MARKRTGSIVETGDSFALRVTANGRRRYVTLGSRADGWDRQRAQDELDNVLADIRRGRWQPPTREKPEEDRDPSFHEFASRWFAGLSDEGLRPATLKDYEWQLTRHLLPFFKVHTLSTITVGEVDRYRQSKVREGALSATSINKTITRLGQILDLAAERDLIVRNPVRVNSRRRKLKERKPERSFLESADQIASLLDAAGELDAEARSDRGTSRRALLATLALAGLRIGEALDLRWRDVDLAAGRLRVGRAKTDAGVRTVDLLPGLRDELAALRARTPDAPNAYVFPSGAGALQNPSNVRNRVLARTIERADERRDESGLAALPPGLTPHSLRRTFASALFALGRELPYVMAQLGHADPKMTLGIYAKVMMDGDDERVALRRLVEGYSSLSSESVTTGLAPESCARTIA